MTNEAYRGYLIRESYDVFYVSKTDERMGVIMTSTVASCPTLEQAKAAIDELTA